MTQRPRLGPDHACAGCGVSVYRRDGERRESATSVLHHCTGALRPVTRVEHLGRCRCGASVNKRADGLYVHTERPRGLGEDGWPMLGRQTITTVLACPYDLEDARHETPAPRWEGRSPVERTAPALLPPAGAAEQEQPRRSLRERIGIGGDG